MLEFRLLGTLEVLYNGAAVRIPRGKPQAILVILLIRGGKPVSTERLIDMLWADRPPTTARQAFYTHMAHLRRSFTNAGIEDPVQKRAGEGYLIETEHRQLDTIRFGELAARGRAAAARERLQDAWEGLDQASALWRGDEPLSGVQCPAVTDDEVAPLRLARIAARQDWCDVGLRLGRHREVLTVVRRLYKDDPLRERTQELLLIAEYQDGGQARGLDVFEDIRRRLLEEAGLDPSDRLWWLQKQILLREPALSLMRQPSEVF